MADSDWIGNRLTAKDNSGVVTQDTVGVTFIGIIALMLLVLLMRERKFNRELIKRLVDARQPQ